MGNLFIADTSNNRIRKVDTNGIISTVAGNRSFVYSGDGVIATNTGIGGEPLGMTLDFVGNIYIADGFNHCIYKVNTNGIINLLAGSGIQGFAGDGGVGKLANLSTPHGIVTDRAGNVYFADTGNNRIRKISFVDYADQASFTLTNNTPASLGNNYSVIVTGPSGSVTSSVVSVILQLPPITPVFTASNSIYTLTWGAVSNLTYQLQSATNLAASIWIDVGSPITATNDSISVIDAAISTGQRFYRVRLWP